MSLAQICKNKKGIEQCKADIEALASDVALLSTPVDQPELQSISVDCSFLASASVDVQNINDAGLVLISNQRLDNGWAEIPNSLVYTGDADSVEISANIAHALQAADNLQRVSPEIILLRNGVEVARSSTGYVRDISGHVRGSNAITFVDHEPQSGATYALSSEQGGLAGIVNSTVGTFSAKAIEKKSIMTLVTDGSGGGEVMPTPEPEPEAPAGPVLGAPADGALVSDNFQEGNNNSPFNLQIRNTTENLTNWQAAVTAPYAEIPNLNAGDYTLETRDNGDGTFSHVFTGTSELGAFANIQITGGLPIPAGDGSRDDLEFYIL